MIDIRDFISNFPSLFQDEGHRNPWEIISNLKLTITKIIDSLGDEFNIENEVAIHKSSVLENGITLKGPIIIMENCHIGANVYLREGIFLDSSVKVGPGSEIKSSLIFSDSAVAHLNYIGNSIIGRKVNFEAGSVVANHFNERSNKMIKVCYRNNIIETGVKKFGALVGDYSKIGANGVLSPGTILEKNSVVRRLELVEQLSEK